MLSQVANQVEPSQSLRMELRACLGERPIGHFAHRLAVAQRTEEGIERGLLRACAHRQQAAYQRR